jgi:putative transcriptional regulator
MSTTKQTRLSRLTRALLETADDMRRVGVLDAAAHAKITLRHLGREAGAVEQLSGDEIRTLRENAHLSQAALARYLNLTVGYISQIERGTKRPSGPALVLLDLIRRKGIEAIL